MDDRYLQVEWFSIHSLADDVSWLYLFIDRSTKASKIYIWSHWIQTGFLQYYVDYRQLPTYYRIQNPLQKIRCELFLKTTQIVQLKNCIEEDPY